MGYTDQHTDVFTIKSNYPMMVAHWTTNLKIFCDRTLLRRFSLVCLLFCSTQAMILSQESRGKSTLFDTLYDMSIDRMEVSLDLDSLLMNKMTAKEHPCTLKVITSDQSVMELPMKASVRSKSRRIHCDFPPLKFDFDKKVLENLNLIKQDDYKIVTHCLDIEAGELVLLKEFMVYQLYNILTPLSLRSKLVNIVYIDSITDFRIEKKAILLESEKEFAENNNGTLCNCMGTPADSIDAMQFETIAMLQYMIGNTDMDHLVERNIKFIKPESGQRWLPFAYDFDFSNLVNAPYVHPKIKDKTLIRRTYLGFPGNAAYLDEVKALFNSKKDAIIDYIRNFDLIPNNERRAAIKYINDFYREINDPHTELNYKKT